MACMLGPRAWFPKTLVYLRQDIMDEIGERRLPTNTELLSMGRSDIRRAISRHGGRKAVAEKAELTTKHSYKGRWSNIETLATELRRFNADNGIHVSSRSS